MINYEKLSDKLANYLECSASNFLNNIIDIVKQCDEPETIKYIWPDGLPICHDRTDYKGFYKKIHNNQQESEQAGYRPFWEYVWYFAPEHIRYIGFNNNGSLLMATCRIKYRVGSGEWEMTDEGSGYLVPYFQHPSPADSLMERPVVK